MATFEESLEKLRATIEHRTGRPLPTLIEQAIGSAPDEAMQGVLMDRKAEEERKEARELRACGIGSRYMGSDLSTYRPRTEQQASALEIVKKYVGENMAADGKGLVFIGEPGGGKTHLIVGILKAERAKGMKVRYLSYNEFIMDLNATYSPGSNTTEADYMRSLARVDVLAIDDIHTVRGDNQYEKLWLLMDLRNRDEKATLTATNRTAEDILAELSERTARRFDAMQVYIDRPKNGK